MPLIRMDSQGKLLQSGSADRLIRMDNQGRLIGGPLHPPVTTSEPARKALLLLDASRSMADDDKFRYAQRGAMRFAESALQKGYQSGLAVFGNEARLITSPIADLAAFNEFVDSTRVRMAGDGTNMAHAFYLAATIPGVTSVVVVTDGFPTNAEEALSYAKELRKRSIDIITIGTEDADRDFLAKVATRKDLAIQVQDANIQKALSGAALLLTC